MDAELSKYRDRIYFLYLNKFLIALFLLGNLSAPVRAQFTVNRIITGLTNPLYITAPKNDNGRIFIVQQEGSVLIFNRESQTLESTAFLNIPSLNETDSIIAGGERGLLGLAFHPQFMDNGFFYVNATRLIDGELSTVITRYTTSSPATNDPVVNMGTRILSFPQPQSNHNGGWIGFDPTATPEQAYLYISSGDGGGGNDNDNHGPIGNAQSLDTLLGKILRIDVNSDAFPQDPEKNYGIPETNPQQTGILNVNTLPEIWAYGLRNPWRMSFDRLTGDLYIGDVGQDNYEETNLQIAGSRGGENYGWRLREGLEATPTENVGGLRPSDNVDPIYTYQQGTNNNEGFSVTGGYLYRGPVSELAGRYIFGDFAGGRIWSIDANGNEFNDLTDEFNIAESPINQIASFAEDSDGNLYIVDLGGEIFQLQDPGLSNELKTIVILLQSME